jgi:CheY-like chemotaxis protein
MAVDVAYDGSTGLDKATVNTYDVIVLDRDLPRVHGDAFCRQIVGSPSTSRILMLTAAARVENRVEGLNLGADSFSRSGAVPSIPVPPSVRCSILLLLDAFGEWSTTFMTSLPFRGDCPRIHCPFRYLHVSSAAPAALARSSCVLAQSPFCLGGSGLSGCLPRAQSGSTAAPAV